MRVVIYGPDGVGKTKFAADAPDPIFIPVETGAEGFAVARFDDPVPRSFEEVLDCVRFLQRETHSYKTAVIDTADMVEQFAYQLAIRKHNARKTKDGPADNIEEVGGGYKKGYAAAAAEWIRLLDELEKLRAARGMNIILCSHSKVTNFKNPVGEDYDRYSLKLHPDAGLGLVKEWPDAVLFATYLDRTSKAGKRGRAKGEGGRERVMYTQHHAAWDAKNRYDLPERLPLDWATFEGTVHENRSPGFLEGAVAALAEQLSGEFVTIGREQISIGEWVQREIAKGVDARRLAVLRNRLSAKLETLEEQRAELEDAQANPEGA